MKQMPALRRLIFDIHSHSQIPKVTNLKIVSESLRETNTYHILSPIIQKYKYFYPFIRKKVRYNISLYVV
jgi:hypothetical protein